MRSVRTLKAHQKVALVAITAVVGGVAVFGITLLGLNDARRQLQAVKNGSGPQVAILSRMTQEVTNTRLLLGAASNATDGATRTLRLQQSLDSSSLAAADWKIYDKHAVGLPGELALQRQYTAAAKAGEALGRAGGTEIIAAPEGATVPRTPNLLLLLGDVETQITSAQELTNLYIAHSATGVSGTLTKIAAAERNAIIAFAVAMILGLAVAIISIRDTRRQEIEQAAKDQVRNEEARRTAFDNRLGVGLDMVRVEGDAFNVLERALVEVVDDHPVELLIADSSLSHFRRSIAVDPEGTHGCDVSTPENCPATRGGQTLVFSSSSSLDACPHLGMSATPHCSAVCVPVATGGQPIGVIHMKGPDHIRPSERIVDDIKVVARKAGERISALRVLADTSAQARTDPLTGLMNRRSLENRVRELVANERYYVVAYADLDHFKVLNDKHGHDTGDRALRLFSQVLADSVRPDDIPCRYGGEEFVVVLPDCNLADAQLVLERVRQMLAERLVNATVPSFTVSFGLSAGHDGDDFNAVVARADGALLTAKRHGRDRIVVAPELDPAALGALAPPVATDATGTGPRAVPDKTSTRTG